ncbi:MAG: toxin-activating lysine-acyltransferase [Hyphomonadaceae bacterium]
MGLFSGKDKDKNKKNGAAAPAPVVAAAAKAPPPARAPDRTNGKAAPAAAAPKPASPTGAPSNAMRALGEITAILMRTPEFQNLNLGSLHALLTPPMQRGQYIVAHGGAQDGPRRPLAACLWAKVSPEVDRRLATTLDQPVRLAPAEWNSGEHIWVILLAGEKRVSQEILKQLQTKVFAGKTIKLRVADEKGVTKVQTLAPQAATAH